MASMKSLLVVACLATVSNAARTHRSTAFLSAGASERAQEKAMTGRKELSLIQMTTEKMEEDIEHVQKALEVAFVEFGHLVEAQPANATNSTKQVHANATNSSVVPQKPANSTAVHSTEKVSASSSNVSQVLSKKGANQTGAQPANSSTAVAVVGTNSTKAHPVTRAAHVRKVVNEQKTLLENLFKHLKSNIVNLNKQENTAKQVAEAAIKRLQERMKKDKAELQKPNLSKFEHDRLVNRTRTDTFELQYWTRDRSLGHSMFHTNLKMQHGLMSRVKSVIAACKDAALKGRIDPAIVKKLKATALPTAFVEMRVNLKHKAQQYYAHVLTARWMGATSETD